MATRRGIPPKILLIIAIAIIAIAIARGSKPPLAPLDDIPTNGALLTIILGDSERRFTGEVVAGMTVADALQLSGLAGNFVVTFDDRGRPKQIDGLSGLWVVRKNDVSIVNSVTQELLAPGDQVLIVPSGA